VAREAPATRRSGAMSDTNVTLSPLDVTNAYATAATVAADA